MIIAPQQYLSGLHYEQSVRKAWFCDQWRRLRGKRTSLVTFDEVAKRVKARQLPVRRLEYVPLNQIVGSVGRARDFTREFLPRPSINPERWARIDAAVNASSGLLPIELYRIGDVYFVDDGNHRTSVARANGFQGIEAYVTKMDAAVWLTAEDFQHDQWLVKTEQLIQEKPMYYDPSLPKLLYEERLKEAELERRARRFAANRPGLQKRLRLQLGDFLVYVGNRVKAQVQPSPDSALVGKE